MLKEIWRSSDVWDYGGHFKVFKDAEPGKEYAEWDENLFLIKNAKLHISDKTKKENEL